MEQYGFARSGVAGEYYPIVAWGLPTATISTTAVAPTWGEAMHTYIVTESPNEQLNVQFSSVSQSSAGASTPRFQITVDGVDCGQTRQTYDSSAGNSVQRRTVAITGLQAGVHKVALNWQGITAGTVSCKVTTVPDQYHMGLVVWRTQRVADREANGFPALNWSSLYTPGATFASLTSNVTDTTTTPNTSLLTASVQTFHPTSALLIRFGAGATAVTANNIAKFRVLVDGAVQGGTSQRAGNVANGHLNTSIVTVVAVQCGWHTVEVQWCGGSTSGSSISPLTNAWQFAELQIEEVFCPDVGNFVPDAAGFATQWYSARNTPQTRFAKLTSDLVGSGAGPPNQVVGQIDLYVTGDNSFVQIETTVGTDGMVNGDSVSHRLWIDKYSSVIGQTTSTGVECGAQGIAYPAQSSAIYRVVRLNQGWHRILATAAPLNALSAINAASSPDTCHGSLVVREIAAFSAINSSTLSVASQL